MALVAPLLKLLGEAWSELDLGDEDTSALALGAFLGVFAWLDESFRLWESLLHSCTGLLLLNALDNLVIKLPVVGVEES